MSNELKIYSNQATPKYLGYVYQVLIAIEQCLISKPNQKIYIECYGDLYSQNTGTEIKHHINKHNLTDNSIDFWKTLKNWITEDISEMNTLILHTTSDIKSDSLFFNWNDISKNDKYKKLENHEPVESINDFYNKIMDKTNKKKLLNILEMMMIKSSQPQIKDKWEELKGNRYLSFIPDNNKDDAFDSIYGYINRVALTEHRKWTIDINDFDRNKALLLRSFATEKTPFPYVDKSEINNKEKGFHFV